MKEKYIKIASNIVHQNNFLSDYSILFKAYILNLVGDDFDPPSKDIALRLCTSAQIFIASDTSENIEMGSRILDMLLDLNPPYLEDIIIITISMFSHLGHYPNVRLINKRWNKRTEIDYSLDHLLQEEMHRSLNAIEKIGVDATNFQVDLWINLQEGNDVVTIAPTSTGKSFIIMQYLVQQMIETEGDSTFAIYIVPTRALIYEISRKLKNMLSDKNIDDIEIATIAQKDKIYKRKTIFVLTQERTMLLLHFQHIMRFSYMVVDEAHNIAEGSRGVLLHIVLSQVIQRGHVQLVFSTPASDFQNTFDPFLGKDDSRPCKTERSPVSKNFIYIKCSGNKLILRSASPAVEIRIPKKFTGEEYAQIVKRLGCKSSNIVYSNTKSICQKIVNKLLPGAATEKKELDVASDYIKQTIHEKYSLAKAIKKGIAFHYGPLPRNIRLLIENYAEKELIDYIVCTSTLAEGVNLPARNLFIRDPKTVPSKRGMPNTTMSRIQYRNIVGRAGRLMKHFSGNVFLVDYDKWEFKEVTEKKSEEHKLPTYFRILQDNTDDLIHLIKGHELGDNVDLQSLNVTLNKIMQDSREGTIEQIASDYLDRSKRRKLIREINILRNNIKIPDPILNLNPTIGIIQQNNFYEYLYLINDIKQLCPAWPIDRNFFDYLLNTLLPLLLEHKFIQLDKIDNEHYRHLYYYKICKIADGWVKGKSIKDIIHSYSLRRPDKAKDSSEIDKIVIDIIGLIENVIRFKLANAVKCFHDIYSFVAEEKDIALDDIPDIYSSLEIGASHKSMVTLISLGLSRQTAIEIFKLMPHIDIDDIKPIDRIKGHPNFNKLHEITQMEINNL